MLPSSVERKQSLCNLTCFTMKLYNRLYTIERGANVNAKSKDGYTALIYAAFAGHAKIVEELVKSGAAVNAVNEYGANALIYAAHKVISNPAL